MDLSDHKTRVVDAHRWFKNGDHPKDNQDMFDYPDGCQRPGGEGKVVRYYRNPEVPGDNLCARCCNPMHIHGWLDNGGPGETVCPGDFIITDRKKYHVHRTHT